MMPKTPSRKLMLLATAGLALILPGATSAHAQASGDSFPNMLIIGPEYGAPERLSAAISGLFPVGKIQHGGGSSQKAVEIRARAGLGGCSVGVGPRVLGYGPIVGPNALVTLTRTFSSPRGAIGHSTYVGLEVGYQVLGRVGFGIARQVDGPANRRDTMLTWTVGFQMPPCMFRGGC